MTPRYCLAVLSGLRLLIFAVCAEGQTEPLQGTVAWVDDADTLEIDKLGRVRLIGIDTPEREASPRDRFLERQGISATRQREIYQNAKALTIRLVTGQRVCPSATRNAIDMAACWPTFTCRTDGC